MCRGSRATSLSKCNGRLMTPLRHGPAVRRFWFLVLLVTDDLQRHGRERYAYQILKRLQAAGETPDEAEVHRLAEFLRPAVRIEQWWSWTDTADASAAEAFDPFSLVSVRLAWDGHWRGLQRLKAGKSRSLKQIGSLHLGRSHAAMSTTIFPLALPSLIATCASSACSREKRRGSSRGSSLPDSTREAAWRRMSP